MYEMKNVQIKDEKKILLLDLSQLKSGFNCHNQLSDNSNLSEWLLLLCVNEYIYLYILQY